MKTADSAVDVDYIADRQHPSYAQVVCGSHYAGIILFVYNVQPPLDYIVVFLTK